MTQVLIGLVAIVAYGLFTVVSPMHPCGRCRGRGIGRMSTPRRFRTCKRCGGTGRRFRIGARAVHRGIALGIRAIRERGDR